MIPSSGTNNGRWECADRMQRRALFSYVDMEARGPATHPLRTIRTIVNEVLAALDSEFEALYEGTGRQVSSTCRSGA